VCYPALPCKLAAVVIHRMLWWKKGVLSPGPCKLAAMIHRMLWWKKGVLSCAAMQARCCCDPQNALVQGRVCYPCAVMQELLS
jgi:hypothetical protein